jgi:hypothetical protein
VIRLRAFPSDPWARGSVVLEQVVAMALLGLATVGIFGMLLTGALAMQLTRDTTIAGELAAQKIEELGGRCAGSYEVPRQPAGSARAPRHEWQAMVEEQVPGLCTVQVTVRWSLKGAERSMTLTTLARRADGEP